VKHVSAHVFCDGPECPRSATEGGAAECWLEVHEKATAFDFCGWDCLLRYAATIEPAEIIDA
jgi:hypothetical protein